MTAGSQPESHVVPVFYVCDDSLPRPSALVNGAVLAAACLGGVCLLLAHGGGFPSVLIGSHQGSRSHIVRAPSSADPVDLSTEVRVRPEADETPVPFYFRMLAIVSALDANHDGVISAGEIAAAPRALAALDANHDGKLDADECGGHFGDEPDAAAPSTAELTRTLMAFDRNHDGKLQRSEVPERLQGIFDRGDPGKTGVLTAADIRRLAEAGTSSRSTAWLDPQFLQRARLAFMRIHPILAALDADRNGEISAAEMRNAPAMLRTLDDDNDGKLSLNEILPDPLSAATAQFVSIFDTNSDLAISGEEWTGVFGKHLRAALARAGRGHHDLVTDKTLTDQIRFNPATGSEDVEAYEEMLAANRQGFAAIVARSRRPQ